MLVVYRLMVNNVRMSRCFYYGCWRLLEERLVPGIGMLVAVLFVCGLTSYAKIIWQNVRLIDDMVMM